jgi:hypothetical protein
MMIPSNPVVLCSAAAATLLIIMVAGAMLWSSDNTSTQDAEFAVPRTSETATAELDAPNAAPVRVVPSPLPFDGSTLAVPAIFQLLIHDAEHSAVPNAIVYGQRIDASPSHWKRMATSNESGVLEVRTRTLPMRLRITATGLRPQNLALYPATPESVSVKMEDAAQITGRAIGLGTEHPIEGAKVIAWEVGTMISEEIEDASFLDAYPGAMIGACRQDGSFTIEGLTPRATYQLSAAAEGWLSSNTYLAPAPSTEALVELTPLYITATQFINADGSPSRRDHLRQYSRITVPPADSVQIDWDSLLPYRQALPRKLRDQVDARRMMVGYFVAPVLQDQIGPYTFETWPFAIERMLDRDHYAHRAIGDIPVKRLVIPAGKGYGNVRIQFDHPVAMSCRASQGQTSSLGTLRINAGNRYGGEYALYIDPLDESDAFVIDEVPVGHHTFTIDGLPQIDPILIVTKEGEHRFAVEAGKTTEIVWAPTNLGSITWRIEDPGSGGEYSVFLKRTGLRTCSFISVRCEGPSGIIPFVPAGSYTFMINGSASESAPFLDRWRRTISVEVNTITEVVFK